jgi:hypothetical protein
MNRYPTPATQPLIVLQINVGKGSIQQEIALAHAYAEKADILLVQKPYIYRDYTRRITTRHPAYECLSPSDDWTAGQPRVLTYIRKQARLQATQLCSIAADSPSLSDTLFLYVTSLARASLLIVNAYNTPYGSIRAGETARALTQLPLSLFLQPTLLAGDFNLHYPHWQLSYSHGITPVAEQFAKWIDNAQLVLAS